MARALSTGPAGRLLLMALDDNAHVERAIMLDGSNVTIGRAPSSTIPLPEDQSVSRLHAMLSFDGQHYWLSDLGSSNGTRVNGIQIDVPTALADGDRITTGQHILIFTSTVPLTPEYQELAQQDAADLVMDGSPSAGSAWGPPVQRAAEDAPDAADSVAGLPASPRALDSGPHTAALADSLVAAVPGEGSAADPDSSGWAPDGPVGPGTGELAQIRHYLVDMSTQLATLTEDTKQSQKRLRTELVGLANHIGGVLADLNAPSDQPSRSLSREALAELVRVADQAAADPHHLNALVDLAGRAHDITAVLKLDLRLLDELVHVRERLSALAQSEGW
jgi:predicted component of type VI protein secretion system